MTEALKKTGWPVPELAQDDCRELFKWFASRPEARLLVRESAARIAESPAMRAIHEDGLVAVRQIMRRAV